MKRREFIAGPGTAASTTLWPLAVRTQERVRRIGVLMHLAAKDIEEDHRAVCRPADGALTRPEASLSLAAT
jgi:hypothetical protein